MRGKEFLDKMELIDPCYVEEADNMADKRKNHFTKWAAAAACLAAVVITGTVLVESGRKISTDTDNLPMLSVSEKAGEGMGFEGYMAYDISEIVNSNPWNENLELSTLPVFENPITYYDERFHLPSGVDYDKMNNLLSDVVGRLGLDTKSIVITDNAPSEEEKQKSIEKMQIAGIYSVPEEYFNPTEITASSGGTEIDVDIYLTADIAFDPALSVPDEYNFSRDASYEELCSAAEYLREEYGSLIGAKQPQANITGGNYDTNGTQHYNIEFFEASGTVTEQIVNYNFNRIAFYADDNGNLYLARIFQPDLSQKIGDYPIISSEQAKELLLDGKYVTSAQYKMPGEEYVKRVELVYRIGQNDKYYMPYYRFYVELPEEEQEDGLKTYGAYYVPALEEQYISNMPNWDGSFNY